MTTQNLNINRDQKVFGHSEFKITDINDQEYNLVVNYDSCPENPREWGNIGTMICCHRRYDLGDNKMDDFLSLLKKCGKTDDELEDMDFYEQVNFLCEQENVCALPLYIYDHGGISMSTGFADSWDSSFVGVIYVEYEDYINKTSFDEKDWKANAKQYLNNEVETYTDYLEGKVYYYELYKATPIIVTKETKNGRVLSCKEEIEQELIDSMFGLYNLTVGDLCDNIPIEVKTFESKYH